MVILLEVPELQQGNSNWNISINRYDRRQITCEKKREGKVWCSAQRHFITNVCLKSSAN